MSGRHDIHWGDAGTWATAVVGGIAAAAALVQLSRQRAEIRKIGSTLESLQAEELDLRLDPLRSAAREARRAQAEHVHCFTGQLTLVEPDGTETSTSYALVQNNSEAQLRRVQARFGKREAARVGELDPNLTDPQTLGEARNAPLAVANRFEGWSFIPPGPNRIVNESDIRVRFTTRNEVRWELTAAGDLREAPDDRW